MLTIDLKQMIRSVPDFPKPGINFFDITTLLKQPAGLQATIDALTAPYRTQGFIRWSASKAAASSLAPPSRSG